MIKGSKMLSTTKFIFTYHLHPYFAHFANPLTISHNFVDLPIAINVCSLEILIILNTKTEFMKDPKVGSHNVYFEMLCPVMTMATLLYFLSAFRFSVCRRKKGTRRAFPRMRLSRGHTVTRSKRVGG